MSEVRIDARGQVVVLLDPRHPSKVALAAAAAIAGERRPHVYGVLIEDQNVLRLGALADVREVTFGGAQIRVPEVAALERQLRADAGEARRAFERAAAELSFAATFDVRYAGAVGELIRSAAGARLLVIGRAAQPATRAWWDAELPRLLAADVADLALVPAEVGEPDGLVAYASGAADDEKVARLAGRIAARTGLGLLPVRVATAGWLCEMSRQEATLQANRIRYLVVSRQALAPAELRELMFAFRCTVVVAR